MSNTISKTQTISILNDLLENCEVAQKKTNQMVIEINCLSLENIIEFPGLLSQARVARYSTGKLNRSIQILLEKVRNAS